MNPSISIRNLQLGTGQPKICIPLTGTTDTELLEEVTQLAAHPYDLVEWRMDYHIEVTNPAIMAQTAKLLREYLRDTPFLATFRTHKEGGNCELSVEDYIKLNHAVIQTQAIDLIDVEFFTGDEVVRELITYAHLHQVKVVVSNHDFEGTPPLGELLQRLCQMQDLGADLPKVAVMPHSLTDVITLLHATHIMTMQHAKTPIITMSMSKLGLISRLVGETFGSCLTFGTAHASSAPGQIPANELSQVLDILHRNQ